MTQHAPDMHPRLAVLPRAEALGMTFPVANRPLVRLLGLARIRDAARVPGLLIPSCRSVHTFGMRFPLMIIFLDIRGCPLEAHGLVSQRQIRSCRRADSVLEIPAGGENSAFAEF